MVFHSSTARGRLQHERKALRQDREWIQNPQNPGGFSAKPRNNTDGTQDLFRWECVIPGKPGTIWEEGRIPLVLTFTEDYAQDPPEAMFKPLPDGSTLFHPNVYADGAVCLDLLKKRSDGGRWVPAHTIKTILIALQTFLDQPNNDDAAQDNAHRVYARDRKEYERRVRAQMEQLKI
jgi:ubiquitin-conjugating enzyme E2 I